MGFLSVIIIGLLSVVIILQVTGRSKNNMDEITSILKQTAEEQRNGVQKQIESGATEQFQRFEVIQSSIHKTLSANRDEVNRQLSEFQQEVRKKLMTIQNASAESNEQIGRGVTLFLQDSRKEQNDQLHAFSEQIDR